MTASGRLWRQIPADLFRFTTTDLRDLHVAVMCALDDAAVLQPAMNLEQVRAAVGAAGWDEPLDDDLLHQVLRQLVAWRLLDATQDHAAHYATPEEFERRNLQWSLTPHGQAAVAGVLRSLEVLRQAVSLQPAVLDAIADGLVDLRALLDGPTADDPRIATRLTEVEVHQQSLVASVRQFNGHLQRLLRDDATTDDVFLDVKRRTVTYLEDYIAGVERPTRRIALAVAGLEELGVAGLWDRALRGANLAPLPGLDPAPAWLAERAKHWEALRVWFAPADGGEPRIRSLVAVARQAILQLLRVLERRWESRRRSASVADDFRALARLFAAADTEDDAHRLYGAAFGLWPARHAHLVVDDPDAVPTSTSWLDAPPVVVAPALRTTGTLTNRGRPRPVADPTALRARRQREQAEDLARHGHLRQSVTTDGTVRLRAFGELAVDAFAELLGLLAAALDTAPASDGTRRALSADGGVEVVLRDPGDGALARLTTESGVLTAPDFWVCIELVDRSFGTGMDVTLAEAAGG